MPTLCVITTDPRRFERSPCLLRQLVGRWVQGGWRVEVPDITREVPPADLAIVHVDRTVVPERYLGVAASYPRAVNVGGADISKRVVSRSLVARGDGWDGPVIVKTNANAGGAGELRGLGPRPVKALRRWVELVARPSRHRALRAARGYTVFDRPSLVPPGCWTHPEVVVERFLPERVDGRYALRMWLFLGDRSVQRILLSDAPVVKGRSRIESDYLTTPVPAGLRRRREEMGLGFGRFDYVVRDGEPVLFDANRTPGSATIPDAVRGDFVDALAPGIDDLMAGA